MSRTWTLCGPDGGPFESAVPGTIGGHRGSRIYGRLGCPSALRAISRGGYVADRIFFLDERTAAAAGYRPCGTCMPDRHRAWKRAQGGDGQARSRTDLTKRSSPASYR